MNAKTSPFRAVSIDPSAKNCCQAVTDQVGTRYLSHEAPHLPLDNCTQPQQCRCRYQHWEDRRHEDRRELVHTMSRLYYSGPERRRQGEDRRKEPPF